MPSTCDLSEKAARTKAANTNPRGKPVLLHGSVMTVRDSQTGETYEIEVRFQNTRTHESRPIGVPVRRRYENGDIDVAQWTTDLLHDAVQRELRKWNEIVHEWIYWPVRIVPQAPSAPMTAQQRSTLRQKLRAIAEQRRPAGVPVPPKPEIVDPGPSGAIVDIVTASLNPQEQVGKDMVERIKQQEENPTEPDPLVADDDFFDREERAAMQAEGRS